MSSRNDWTIEQITITLYEYCRNPFGQFNATKSFVKELALLIGRSPAAIVRKVGNLASFDPQMKERGVNGLSHTSKLDEIVWNKYFGNWGQLAYDAETLIAKYKELQFEDSLSINLNNLPTGTERTYEIKKRINQKFFRDTVIASYEQRCCITGINNLELLNACHIVEWSTDIANRTNPQNGLCLNVLFHKAYDENLIGITPDYEIIVSERFFGEKAKNVDKQFRDYIQEINGRKLMLPKRFYPDRNLLAQHYDLFCKY